jgi:hypothetical protein
MLAKSRRLVDGVENLNRPLPRSFAMANDLVQCPLCEGLSKISRAELICKLSDPALLAKVDKLLAELHLGSDLHPEPIPVGAGSSDFQAQVHSWNPTNPMWKRSPKE